MKASAKCINVNNIIIGRTSKKNMQHAKKMAGKKKSTVQKKDIIITLILYVGLKHKKRAQKKHCSVNGSNFL